MKTIGAKVLIFFGVCAVCAAPSFAADKKRLSDALASVEANLKTAAGKHYDERIGQEFPAKYTSIFRQCKQSNPSAALDPFDVFLRLNPEGKVQEALVYPKTALAVCTRIALQSGQFSAPPQGEYWINIHLQAKR